MSEEDLNTYKKYVSDLDITKYIVLDSGSNCWYSAEHVNKMLKKQDKEIERLNNLLKETSQTLSEQTTKAITLKSENERLNNIINELEKELKDRIKNVPDTIAEVYEDESILYELQELKGSDKE